MSKDLNLCQFIGHLGNDPDIRMTASGTVTASFNLACGDDYKDKNGQKVEQTNWVKCVCFGRLAEIMRDYLKKGSKAYVSGKQVTRKWQDKNGADQYTTEINVSDMQMLDSKPQGSPQQAARQPQQGYQNQPNPTYQQPQQRPQTSNQPNPRQQQPADNFDSEDIPF
jgi:single-strand DNA-binding protein